MPRPRYFTVDEANRMLPDIERAVRRLRRLRDETVKQRRRLEKEWTALEEDEVPLSTVAEEQQRLDALQEEIKILVEELEGRGVILKDLTMGLVDFLAKAGRAEIFLCWRLGETSIGFWHGLEEGFAGRKPLASLPKGVH